MRKMLISILISAAGATAMNGQDVVVTVAFDSSRIYIGDQINYTVTVEQPSGLNLGLKPIKDTLCKNIEVLSGPVIDTTLMPGDRLKYISKYLITSFDSGIYKVPPFYAEINNENGIRRFYSDYSFLEVMRVKIAPQDTSIKIFDIVAPYKAPLTIGEILPWILLALVAAALIWGIIILLRKFKRSKKEPEVLINPDPAHIIAFRELEKLKNEQLWQKGEVKLYYSRLTEIVRQYLENRYNVYSLEMTTSETLEALLKTGFKRDESFASLKLVLNGSDLVKFAKYKPEPSENEQHFQDSWQFVETTMVREAVVADDHLKEKEGKSS
ncbi:MAG: hypothetical protein NT092_12900 [Bacteroidia bacterium]|nr:hypothetical protein [Bacteroidia bacterium]